jgi:hypothetical protein
MYNEEAYWLSMLESMKSKFKGSTFAKALVLCESSHAGKQHMMKGQERVKERGRTRREGRRERGREREREIIT